MKLTTTATLIIIAEIKWTLQTPHIDEDLKRANGHSITQDGRSINYNVINNDVLLSSCQPTCMSAPLKNIFSELAKQKVNLGDVLSNYADNLSKEEEPQKNSNSNSSKNIIQQKRKKASSYPKKPQRQISKKTKVDEEASALPKQQKIKENNVKGRARVLAKRNPLTKQRTVSQQQPSVVSQPAVSEYNVMKSPQPLQKRKSSQKRNLKKSSEYSIEVASKKRAKMNDGSILYSADIQSNPETSINTSPESTNSNKNTENIWSWIKNRLMQGKNVYTDFCTPQIYKEIFNSEKVQKLTGYYSGFADDLKEYIKEHRQRTEAEKKKQIDDNKSIRKYTLGDLYMKQELNSNSITECKTSSEKRYDHKSLPNKAQTIFNIPEIYQDLALIPNNTFTETLENAKQLHGLTLIQVALLKYLYSTLHSKSNSDKYLSILENEIILTGRAPSIYSAEELYKQAYEAMVVFYKNADYSYEDEDTGKTIEIQMMGKDVILEQACMKCEAIIAKDGDAHNSPYRMIKGTVYTPMPHH